jgi:hypothetical protein
LLDVEKSCRFLFELGRRMVEYFAAVEALGFLSVDLDAIATTALRTPG